MTSMIAHKRPAMRKLLWVGPLAIVLAAIANSIVRALAIAFFGVSETFQYLQPSTIIGSTIIFLLLALLAFIIVCRTAQRPARSYCIVAFIALFVSFLSPLMLLLGLMPSAGMTLSIFWTMIVMHIVSAAMAIGLFTKLALE